MFTSKLPRRICAQSAYREMEWMWAPPYRNINACDELKRHDEPGGGNPPLGLRVHYDIVRTAEELRGV
jgi:hypothetical protein